MHHGLPYVSIIIPVFNQGEELLRCLRALEAQSYPRNRFEVIAVDNGSERPLCPLIERFSFARCIRELKPGSYVARNRGIQAARGELLGFTDADCVPASSWIERGVRAVRALPGAGMVAGKIELTLLNPSSPTAAELFEVVFGFPQETYIGWGFGATANLFTTRATVDQVGLFDEQLMSSGDLEWGHRLRSQGLAQVYADDVRVSHAARSTLRQLREKSLRVAGGIQQLADRHGLSTLRLFARTSKQLIQMGRIRAHINHEQLGGFKRKVKFVAVVWIVELSQTLERFRVHFGGTPRRT